MRAKLFLCAAVTFYASQVQAQPKVPPQPAKAPAPAKPAPAKPKVAALTAGYAPPAYLAMVKKWHEPAKTIVVDGAGRPKLVLYSINRGERVELEAKSDLGGFGPVDLERASWILRSADGQQHPPDPRVLDVAYALQRKFGAGEVRFLSGYRTPKKSGSNHGFGRAIDLVIPGATDEEVATYARSAGFCGVGIYPTSGFVHVDVRDRSFFWADKSGPGKPNKTVGILANESAASDQKAKKDGKLGTESAKIARDVDAVLAARAKAVASCVIESGDDPYDDEH
ncbi:MAG: YcbK family protein [Polyangiales bacterium]